MKHETIYMTAAQLGITEAEHEGLIWVADELASGRIRHHYVTRNDDFAHDDAPVMFNMNYDCGTACCIGGWVAARSGISLRTLDLRDVFSGVLQALFYPDEVDSSRWDDITPAQAAAATRNFLSGGDPRWSEVLA